MHGDTTGPGIPVAGHMGMDWRNVESPILERGTRSWGVEVEMGYVGVGCGDVVTWRGDGGTGDESKKGGNAWVTSWK